jgi:hypothetical protein
MANEKNDGAGKAQVAQSIDEKKLKEAIAKDYETWRQERINNAYNSTFNAPLSEEVTTGPSRGDINQFRQLTGAFGDDYKHLLESRDLDNLTFKGFEEVTEPTFGDLMVAYETPNYGLGKQPLIITSGLYNGKGTKKPSIGVGYNPWISAKNSGKFSQDENYFDYPNKKYYRFVGTDEDKVRIQKETEDRIRKQMAEVQAQQADWEANAPMETSSVANIPVNDTAVWLSKIRKRK